MKKYPYHTVGEKYHEVENLDIKDIAKLVRQDLKTLFKNWPHTTASVRIQRYSMGQSINVYLEGTHMANHSPEGRDLKGHVTRILDQYNFNDNDTQSDYHHVNFHSYVKIES